MDLYTFDAVYLERLSAGDPSVERHFNSYFGELILIKLRARRFDRHQIEDIRQETFVRVLEALRRDGIHKPERIGAFVIGVCNHVVLEFVRSEARLAHQEQEVPEPLDGRADAEQELVTREEQAFVRSILSEMTSKDRQLLTEVFLEERTNEEVSRRFGVAPGYLRVLLYRARKKFREATRRRPDRGATQGR